MGGGPATGANGPFTNAQLPSELLAVTDPAATCTVCVPANGKSAGLSDTLKVNSVPGVTPAPAILQILRSVGTNTKSVNVITVPFAGLTWTATVRLARLK